MIIPFDYLRCGGAHFISKKKAADPNAIGKAARKKTQTNKAVLTVTV